MADKFDLSRFGISYAGADPAQLARMNAEMDSNPIDSQQPPEGWQVDRSAINPIPAYRTRTIAGQAHPPLEVLDGTVHEDVIRRYHIEPAEAEHKRFLDANRKRLQKDRQKWWEQQK